MRLQNKLLAAFLAPGFLLAQSAQLPAEDWMFRRSYYSHADSAGFVSGDAPRSRSAYRPAYVAAHPSGAIRGGYRWNNIRLYNGSGYDNTVTYESWFDAGY